METAQSGISLGLDLRAKAEMSITELAALGWSWSGHRGQKHQKRHGDGGQREESVVFACKWVPQVKFSDGPCIFLCLLRCVAKLLLKRTVPIYDVTNQHCTSRSFTITFYSLFVVCALSHHWLPGVSIASLRWTILWVHDLISFVRVTLWFTSFVAMFSMISIPIAISTTIMLAEKLGLTQCSRDGCQGSPKSMDAVVVAV